LKLEGFNSKPTRKTKRQNIWIKTQVTSLYCRPEYFQWPGFPCFPPKVRYLFISNRSCKLVGNVFAYYVPFPGEALLTPSGESGLPSSRGSPVDT